MLKALITCEREAFLGSYSAQGLTCQRLRDERPCLEVTAAQLECPACRGREVFSSKCLIDSHTRSE